MTRHPTLPRALRANALASLVTGCAGVLMAAPLVQTIGLIPGESFQVLGGLLLVHTGVLLWATGRASITFWTRLNIVGLVCYVAALTTLVIFAPIATPLGRGLVAADALLVAALALWQVRALSRSAPQPAQ